MPSLVYPGLTGTGHKLPVRESHDPTSRFAPLFSVALVAQ
jgi:hypothetical protein